MRFVWRFKEEAVVRYRRYPGYERSSPRAVTSSGPVTGFGLSVILSSRGGIGVSDKKLPIEAPIGSESSN
jgi:hypothetical protein